jgi:GATA-binding protein, other eukaryote
MAHSSTTTKTFPDSNSQWSQTTNSTTQRRRDLASRASSSTDSPDSAVWSQNQPLAVVSEQSSQAHNQNGQLDSSLNLSSLSDSDWNSIFSAPLNPSMFAALAAGGILGQVPAQGQPVVARPSIPASQHQRFHNSYNTPAVNSVSAQLPSTSWTQPSAVYNSNGVRPPVKQTTLPLNTGKLNKSGLINSEFMSRLYHLAMVSCNLLSFASSGQADLFYTSRWWSLASVSGWFIREA